MQLSEELVLLAVPLGHNPCFSGRLNAIKIKHNHNHYINDVAILVLVEDLMQFIKQITNRAKRVAILVFVEDLMQFEEPDIRGESEEVAILVLVEDLMQ